MNTHHNIPSHSENDNWDETNQILDQMEPLNKFNANTAWQSLHHRLENDGLLPNESRISKLRFLYPYAAAAALIILVAGAWFYKSFKTIDSETQLVASANPEQPFILPDGSKIYLYNGAKASFSSGGFNTNRHVNLNGEAFFDIQRDPSNPFTINAGSANIKVLGTSFLVRPEGIKTTVIVNTGKVRLSAIGNETDSLLLEPGFEGIQLNGTLIKQPNTNANYMSWVNHHIVFKAASLQTVIETINKTYACHIELANTEMTQLELTATYNGFSVQNIVESLSLTLNLEAQYTDKSIILRMR